MAQNLPVTLGVPLKSGALAAGAGLVVQAPGGAVLPTQWNQLRTWPGGGSVMHGAATFLTPLSGSNNGEYSLVPGTPLTGAAVSKAELLASAFACVASVTISGTVYSLSARHLLDGTVTPRRDYTHLSGPLMSEFCVGGPLRINGTGTAHSTLQAYFNIRAYKIGGSVTRAYVGLSIENTGARVEGFDVTGNVAVTLAGATVYTNTAFVLRSDRRYPLRLWWPSDPQTWVRHNRQDLADTRLVPQYDTITVDSAWLNTMPQTLAWGATGELDPAMASGGGKRELAPLDGWTAAYLISGDRRAFNAMRAHNDAYHWLGLTIGDLAWNFRDENTGFPIDLQANPTMTSYNYNPSGVIRHRSKSQGAVYTDLAHMPCSGYVPYLLTAEFDELEQTQFHGIHPWMNWAPGGGTGWPRPWSDSGNVRDHAWGFRNVSNAAVATPNAHPLYGTLDALCSRALSEMDSRFRPRDAGGATGLFLNTSEYTCVIYSPGDTPNPTDTGTRTGVSMWMDDWVTWAIAFAAERGYSNTTLLNWKSQSVIRRFVGSNWCWAYTPYALGVRDNDAGALYTSWNTLWSKNYPGVSSCPASGGQVQSGNDARGDDYFPQIGPALATLASLGVADATQAWNLYAARTRPAQDASWTREKHPQWWIVRRSAPPVNGLRFPSNGESGAGFTASSYVAFALMGANLPASAWPMTYIWRLKPRQHTGYYTTFFWGNTQNVGWLAQGYYGFHPYPPAGPSGTTHNWEISIDGADYIVDTNGNNTTVIKDGRWFTQAARVTAAANNELLAEYWWDMAVSAARRINYTTTSSFRSSFPSGTPGIIFGDAPWARAAERLSGTLGQVKIIAAALTDAEIQQEAADMTRLVTPAAQAARWWFKPTFASADDLTDAVTGRTAVWQSAAKATIESIG